MLVLSVGFIGLLLRYGKGVGSLWRFSLGLGALSGGISAVGATDLGIQDSNPWWSMFFLGMVFQFLGLGYLLQSDSQPVGRAATAR
jgi:hypothetical protein